METADPAAAARPRRAVRRPSRALIPGGQFRLRAVPALVGIRVLGHDRCAAIALPVNRNRRKPTSAAGTWGGVAGHPEANSCNRRENTAFFSAPVALAVFPL